MIEKSELLRVPAFTDLPDDQLDWFISQSQELILKAVMSMPSKALPPMRCL